MSLYQSTSKNPSYPPSIQKADSSIYNINKLTESNYRSWAQLLRWIPDEQNLVGYCRGKKEKRKGLKRQLFLHPLHKNQAAQRRQRRRNTNKSLRNYSKVQESSINNRCIDFGTYYVVYRGINDPAEMCELWRKNTTPRHKQRCSKP